jgi:hypothetical protein
MLQSAQMSTDAVALLSRIVRIRAVVRRDGGVTVDTEELRLLCPDSLTVSEQFMRIASIAQAEGWSFAFLPGGSVRFGAYTAA